MARQGKATVVLLGTVAGLAVIVAGAGITLQMRERDLRLAKERELVLVKGQRDELEQQLREARQAKQHIEDELAKAKAKFDEVAKQLDEERKAKETLAKSVDERQREIDRIGKDLEQIRTERTTLSKQVATLQQEQEAAQKQFAELQQAKAQLETKVMELSEQPTVELEKVVVSGPGAGSPGSSALPVQQASATQGQVLVVNREYDFVVVNLGRNQGVAMGQELQIVRDQKVLGRAKVEKIYDELSAAALLPESKKDAIREGDAVKAI
jgi:DNA repair exonuclease SbcCD ATPase subunit